MTNAHPEHVLTTTAPDLLAFFRRRVSSPEDAADLVAETISAAWRAARRMPADREQARMWVFGVAQNTLRHFRRSQMRRDALTARLAAALDPTPWEDDAEGVEVRAAVDALPNELGELLRLVHWDGFSLEQASTLMGVPASTTRSRHARAKELLRIAISTPAATD